MHEIRLPRDVLERIRKRRGHLHMYDDIHPARTALLVVDMQNFFLAPGQLSEIPTARAVVPNINRLADSMRSAGGTVVWITTVWSDQTWRTWSVFFENFFAPENARPALEALHDDSFGRQLWSELEQHEDDWHVVKDRFSAFIHGSSDIEERLCKAEIDTVIVTGTLTSVCCESTARDAMMRNFKVIMVSDGNATHSDADHNASLAALFQVFADVQTANDVIDRLHRDATEAAE
jgi:ureidoacrylate peracid hydrolase